MVSMMCEVRTIVLKRTLVMVLVIAAANSGFFVSPEIVNCRYGEQHCQRKIATTASQ